MSVTPPDALSADPLAFVPDAAPLVNNPLRVAPAIERAEGGPDVQAGVIRAITVIGEGPQVVGSHAPLEGFTMIANTRLASSDDVERAPEDGIYVTERGDPFQVAKGDVVPAGTRLRTEQEQRVEPAGTTTTSTETTSTIDITLDDAELDRIVDAVTARVIEGVTAAIRFNGYPAGYQTPESGRPVIVGDGGPEIVSLPETPETPAQRKTREKAEKPEKASPNADGDPQP